MNHQRLSFIIKRKAGTRQKNSKRFGRVLTTFLAASILATFLSSCAVPTPDPDKLEENTVLFEAPIQNETDFSASSVIEEQAAAMDDDYILGPGDVLSLEVWNREGISNPDVLVGPDGVITIARIGNIKIGGVTREEAARKITEALAMYYKQPEVSLVIKEYNNNKAFVLGRIENPGVVKFPGQGTLLEALSLAGGLPVLHKDITLTRCAIIRGNDLVIWIDLRELLHNGNMALNARIKNNDVIFIPEGQDELVYVMGEVLTPGAISLSPQMTYLDALMLAGGPSKSANLEKTFILRFDGKNRAVREINLSDMLKKGELQHNVLMQDNDVIYVAESGMSKFNYNLTQMLPFLQVLNLSTNSLERFGVMQELRKELWDQEGFVDGGYSD
jgi:polysaccharide export outer membrane protein